MVESIGSFTKSSKKGFGKFQKYFGKTIDKLEISSYDTIKKSIKQLKRRYRNERVRRNQMEVEGNGR